MDAEKLYEEALVDEIPSTILFEDEYRIVFNMLGELSEKGKKIEKRVQIVQWKKTSNKDLNFDIRYYDTTKKIYTKGISLNTYELKELKKILDDFDFEMLN